MSASFIGRVLRDRYRVESSIGSGRMADVYRGYDIVLDRAVAIKVLTGGDAPTRARFVDEARAMARMTHQHIVAIYDFGESDGYSYIVMEYVDGASLAELRDEKTPFPRLQKIFAEVLSALEEAHRKNIVHRDLKPANILLAEDGTVKVADFGLSRRISDLTTGGRAGEIIGTVSYLPPEVFLGKPSDGRGDLYSIGVMMYEAFTKRLPFRNDSGDIVAVIYAHVHELPVPPRAFERALPTGFERLILKLLEKEPERRYTDAAEVSAELQTYRFATETLVPVQQDVHPPSVPPSVEPGIRTILDRMLSPQRSTKAAFGKILNAMLAARRREFVTAIELYDEALLELRALKSESEYIKGAINMGECMAIWMRSVRGDVDARHCQAVLGHLEEAKTLARLRGQTRELHTCQGLLGEVESLIR